MSTSETIVRLFETSDVTPTPFTKPGVTSQLPIRVVIGLKGGSKTFSWAGSSSLSTRMGHKHTETAPSSSALQDALTTASAGS